MSGRVNSTTRRTVRLVLTTASLDFYANLLTLTSYRLPLAQNRGY